MSEKSNFCRFLGLICIFFIEGLAYSQQPDYRRIFGSDWDKADTFVSDNEFWLKAVCDKNKISFNFAVAVIFPELVRYSALKDKIEITLLKALYVNLGEEYADFSIGPFQMKPSFAEKIIENSKTVKDRRVRNLFRQKSSIKEIADYRAAIVADLEDPEKEFIYLMAFIRICESSFGKDWADDLKKLSFFASAYNSGFDRNREYIEKMSERKFFSTSIYKRNLYSYSDISLYWYNLNRNNR